MKAHEYLAVFVFLLQPALHDVLLVDTSSVLLRRLDILSRSEADVPLLLGAPKDVPVCHRPSAVLSSAVFLCIHSHATSVRDVSTTSISGLEF